MRRATRRKEGVDGFCSSGFGHGLGTNGVDGVKTGKTARAGDCLILSAHREAEIRKDGEHTSVTPRNLIIVMLGSANRFTEGGQLLARGWQLYDQWAAGGRMVDPNKTL